MKHRKNINNHFSNHQDEVNVEIFHAIEALGQRLKSSETTRNSVEERLEDLESGAEVDEDTGKYYLPLVIDAAQLPDTINIDNQTSSKTVVLSSFISFFVAITALVIVLLQEPSTQVPAVITGNNAQFAELNIPWASENWQTVDDVNKQAEQERIIAILMQRLEKNEEMMTELQQRQIYVENQYAKALLSDIEIAENNTEIEPKKPIEKKEMVAEKLAVPEEIAKISPAAGQEKKPVVKKVEIKKAPKKVAKVITKKPIVKKTVVKAPVKTAVKSTPKRLKIIDGTKPNPSLPTELKALEKRAFEGDSAAQHDLGALYASGQVMTADYKRAAYWFLKAAENGVANANYNLGVMYHQGMGLQRDVKKALYWYREAAALAHPEALYNLGIAYVEGIGTPVDTPRGIGYLKRAAGAGVAQAAYNLGVLYEGHFSNEKDSVKKAIKWYDYAGKMGYADGTLSARRLKDGNTTQIASHNSPSQKVLKIPSNLNDIETAAGYELFPPIAVMEEGSAGDTYDTRTTAYPVQLVSRIQRVLIDMGLLPATTPTGSVDLKTTDAIRAFQRKSKMVVDGVPSQDLLDYLISSK